MEFFIILLVWVIIGLGLGVLAGLIARAVCRRRGMYQLGDRAFWVCLICGILNLHVIAALAFCIMAYTRDTDVGSAYNRAPTYSGGNVSPVIPAPSGRSLRLTCVSGPLSGQSYVLGSGVLSIGTDPSNIVRLPAGTPGVSRRHCCVRWQSSAPQLVDLGSTYGTYLLDGRKLPPQYPTELAVGSRFYLGEPGCMFQISLN